MTTSHDPLLKECLVCQSSNWEELFVDCRDNHIAACKNCGLQFMNPQYTDAHLKEYYSQYGDFSSDGLEKWEEPLLYGHDFYFQLIERFTRPPAKMLDIGSGTGFLLRAALKRGWTAEGYDVDPELTSQVSQKLKIPIHSGDFFSIPVNPGSYDLVTMHQVLEHVKQPIKYLKRVHTLLKPGGHFFIAVPNIGSLSNRVKFTLERLGIRRKRVGVYYDSNHHLSYFKPQVLRATLEAQGFTVCFTRNCHTVKPGQSSLSRLFAQYFSDHIFSKSAFLMVAQRK